MHVCASETSFSMSMNDEFTTLTSVFCSPLFVQINTQTQLVAQSQGYQLNSSGLFPLSSGWVEYQTLII